jgi:hypothetical protein
MSANQPVDQTGTNGAAPVTDMSRHPDISAMKAAAGSGRRQSMRGFDEDYVDIVDYIVRCTHKIWEE